MARPAKEVETELHALGCWYFVPAQIEELARQLVPEEQVVDAVAGGGVKRQWYALAVSTPSRVLFLSAGGYKNSKARLSQLYFRDIGQVSTHVE